MQLREYQEAAVQRVIPLLERGVCLVLPTGGGKTRCSVEVQSRASLRSLFVVHRREIVLQAAASLRDEGLDVGVILAGVPEDRSASHQVASVQTLARREIPDGDLLVLDEAHHATSPSYRRIIAKFDRRLYLTATPARTDGKGLRGAGVNELVIGATPGELCAAGILHAPIVYGSAGPDLSHAHRRGGDFAAEDLRAVSQSAALTGQVLETWLKRADNRRTFGFAIDVDHARVLCDKFLAAGIPTEVVTGETPVEERPGILARFAAGVTRVVWNVQVLTEGIDVPSCEVIDVARPTDSLTLHLQMIGRAMRSSEGKDGSLVLDHAGNHFRHGFVTDDRAWSLDDRPKGSGEAPVKDCPRCQLIQPAGTRTCPKCGYEFPVEDRTTESAAELLPIGHADSFEERTERWRSYCKKAARIAAARTGQMFSGSTKALTLSIAKHNYRARYGEYPLAIGDRLIDPALATPAELAFLEIHDPATARRLREATASFAWGEGGGRA